VKVKNIVIAFIVLVALFVVILWFNKKSKETNLSKTYSPSITEQIEDKFKNINIPQDAEKTELVDVAGGDSMGIATRTEILADLPSPSFGNKYQAWIVKDGNEILLGNLSEKKGGWILEYNSSKYPGYNKVVIKEGAKVILEGSF
jgi:hypothetical protein